MATIEWIGVIWLLGVLCAFLVVVAHAIFRRWRDGRNERRENEERLEDWAEQIGRDLA